MGDNKTGKSKIFYFILFMGVVSVNTSVIFTRYALQFGASPIIIGFWRLFFTSCILIPWALFKEGKHFTTLRKREIALGILAGVFLAAHFFCYFSSLIYTNAFITTITSAVQPIIIGVLSFFIFKEVIQKKSIYGMVVAVIGIAFIGYCTFLTSSKGGSFAGFLFSVGASVFFCFYMLCSRGALMKIKQYTYLAILFTSCAVVLFLGVLITKTPLTGYNPMVYLNSFGLTIFCTILGHSVLNVAVKYIPATDVSVITLLGPIFATAYDYIFFGEVVNTYQVVGGIIIAAGVFIYVRYQNMKSEEIAEDITDGL